jgi:hypothetical protein
MTSMQTECSTTRPEFGTIDGRRIEASFDGGTITSNGGALVLGKVDKALRLTERLSSCFEDNRDQILVEHTVSTLVGQRIFGLALGYEDIVDHDVLRKDPVFAALAGKLEANRSDCSPVAGKSTLNRLEQSRESPSRYHKISYNAASIEALFIELFIEAYKEAPKEIILDLDATDDPLHGEQEGRFFHGYYDCYCYLPLYIFCGRHLLVSKLRKADIDASSGATEELERIVKRVREVWPNTRIWIRADSGFARDPLMMWCKNNNVDFVIGLAKNERLNAELAEHLADAAKESQETGKSARRFKDFRYRTRDSWEEERRVIGKAEWMPPTQAEADDATQDKKKKRKEKKKKKAATVSIEAPGRGNPRFIVTSAPKEEYDARALYEKFYCARGEMENRIKECQLDLFADRTSCHTMRANQLRLWFSSLAYVLVSALRRIGLRGTKLADATCGTIRLQILKIGAVVKKSVRRVLFQITEAFPRQHEYLTACAALSN